MARRIDLTGENISRERRKMKAYATQTPLASTTVERGSTHWTDGSNVNIDGQFGVAGTANMTGEWNSSGTNNFAGDNNLTGTTSISGPLTVSGNTSITGATEISGSLDVTGPTNLNGVTEIGGDTTISGLLNVQGDSTISGKLDVTGPMATKGALAVEGVTTLSNDLNIEAGGKITAGQTTIEPDGKATFGDVVIDPNTIYMVQAPGGNMVSGPSDQISLSSSTSSSVSLDGIRAELNYKGTALRVEGGQIIATGKLRITDLPSKPASELTPLGVDASGNLYRIA